MEYDFKDMREKYDAQRWQCQYKKTKDGSVVKMVMSFDEWCAIWIASGKWFERGTGAGKYVMARHGPDIGDYAVGNVTIKLWEDNVLEANKGRPRSEKTRLKQSESRKGKGLGPRTKKKCQHCGSEAGPGLFERYHDANCKKLREIHSKTEIQ